MLSRLYVWLMSFRLRTLFRLVFLMLAVATVALALMVLKEEKQQSFDNYRDSFLKTGDQIAARLKHPTGQLALLNPQYGPDDLVPLRPMLLPYSALDFDDQAKVRNAVEMSGCMVQYPRDAALCVAVGSSQWAGAFIYVAGKLRSGDLVSHTRGERDLGKSHRVRVQVALRGVRYQWLAPFEAEGELAVSGKTRRGRLTGFAELENGDYANARPQRDFRGWIWQSANCMNDEASKSAADDCEREVFYSIRLPIELLYDELIEKRKAEWPPSDLGDIRVHLQVLSPNDDAPVFDSDSETARAPFLLADLKSLLLPGESLWVRRLGKDKPVDVLNMLGGEDLSLESSPAIDWLLRKLPVDAKGFNLEWHNEIATPVGRFELLLTGDIRSANRILAGVVTRVSWFVGAMLLAIALAWFLIELGIIRRLAVLTRRTRAVQRSTSAEQGLEQLNVADLRGGDELGILASCLHDLLLRVREDIDREKIRAEQEKDMWHAVGHEIMSPLQSLLALHNDSENPSQRYLQRMQQAIRVLYGSASPSEAFETTRLQISALDLDAFLAAIARNAPCAGIDNVIYNGVGYPLLVRADEYPLEDVVTHVLRNAERFRVLGSPITIGVELEDTGVQVRIHNLGPQIPADMLDKIFEYGVSDQQDSGAQGNRGQGLFVAKTYMAKMGGTISAHNTADGVAFVLGLPRVKE